MNENIIINAPDLKALFAAKACIGHTVAGWRWNHRLCIDTRDGEMDIRANHESDNMIGESEWKGLVVSVPIGLCVPTLDDAAAIDLAKRLNNWLHDDVDVFVLGEGDTRRASTIAEIYPEGAEYYADSDFLHDLADVIVRDVREHGMTPEAAMAQYSETREDWTETGDDGELYHCSASDLRELIAAMLDA